MSGLFDCLMSELIKADIVRAFGRPKLGALTPAMVEHALGPLWDMATWVDPAPEEDVYVDAVSDPGDIGVLRTAGAVFLDPDLAARGARYIVTGNVSDFRGPNLFGFRILRPQEYWPELVDAEDAAAVAAAAPSAG